MPCQDLAQRTDEVPGLPFFIVAPSARSGHRIKLPVFLYSSPLLRTSYAVSNCTRSAIGGRDGVV